MASMEGRIEGISGETEEYLDESWEIINMEVKQSTSDDISKKIRGRSSPFVILTDTFNEGALDNESDESASYEATLDEATLGEAKPDEATLDEATPDEGSQVKTTNCEFCSKVFLWNKFVMLIEDTFICCEECYRIKHLSHKYIQKLRTCTTNWFGGFFGAMVFVLIFFSIFFSKKVISFSNKCFTLKEAAVEKCRSFYSEIDQSFVEMFEEDDLELAKIPFLSIILAYISYSLGVKNVLCDMYLMLGVASLFMLISLCLCEKLNQHLEKQLDHYNSIRKKSGLPPIVK